MLDFIDEKLRFREEASNVRVKGWEVELDYFSSCHYPKSY